MTRPLRHALIHAQRVLPQPRYAALTRASAILPGWPGDSPVQWQRWQAAGDEQPGGLEDAARQQGDDGAGTPHPRETEREEVVNHPGFIAAGREVGE